MSKAYERIKSCSDFIGGITDFTPQAALVLGSGLGNFADKIDKVCEVKYCDIPNFPVSTVSGHEGKFVFGYVGKVKLVCMQGRIHYYEGYSVEETVLPIRVMRLLGADKLILTNAAGGINKEFTPGDLMLISGQISSFMPSPLRGENIEELGIRFPDMSRIYDNELSRHIASAARTLGIAMQKGVYIQVSGPNYETPEEISAFKILGADAVGMSTSIEAIAARHAGMTVAGVSLITNYAAGLCDRALSHEEVKEAAGNAEEKFEKLIYGSIEAL